jgi:hypothetical protein
MKPVLRLGDRNQLICAKYHSQLYINAAGRVSLQRNGEKAFFLSICI